MTHNRPLFPLVRHLSAPCTRLLLPLPYGPNQITLAAIALGLAAAALLGTGHRLAAVAAGLCLTASYLLDNCDGEIARQRGQCTPFGAALDTFGDWLVHTALFLGLGLGVARASGATGSASPWLWLGVAAALGGTVNYLLGLYLDWARTRAITPIHHPATISPILLEPTADLTWRELLIFAFRELARADFCLLLLALTLFDLHWLLLPAAAVGAQAYWLLQLSAKARSFHV
jgi:phosphatidylglycerophosphate synthase